MSIREPLPVVGQTARDVGEQALCQLQRAPYATFERSAIERLAAALDKTRRRFLRRARKVIADPAIVLRKSAHLFDRSGAHVGATSAARPSRIVPHDPPLAPGDRVRVRSYEEIEATFDATGTCGGMSFLPVVMQRFCGCTFTVRGRVDRFFDERRWKMLRLRDTVILNDVFCEPPRESDVEWAGCTRSCFLFWKEAWLERISPGTDAERHVADAHRH